MATRHSDHDLYVILADGAATGLTRYAGHRSPELDLVVLSLDVFRAAGGHERYALARAPVVLDRLDGGIGRLLADKARPAAEDASARAGTLLDAYANSLHRSVKNDRDGQPLAARLDAADSLGPAGAAVRAGPPAPPLQQVPALGAGPPLPGWATGELLDSVDRISATGDIPAQRRLFARVEAAAREAGLGAVLDAWGDDLTLMRPRP